MEGNNSPPDAEQQNLDTLVQSINAMKSDISNSIATDYWDSHPEDFKQSVLVRVMKSLTEPTKLISNFLTKLWCSEDGKVHDTSGLKVKDYGTLRAIGYPTPRDHDKAISKVSVTIFQKEAGTAERSDVKASTSRTVELYLDGGFTVTVDTTDELSKPGVLRHACVKNAIRTCFQEPKDTKLDDRIGDSTDGSKSWVWPRIKQALLKKVDQMTEDAIQYGNNNSIHSARIGHSSCFVDDDPIKTRLSFLDGNKSLVVAFDTTITVPKPERYLDPLSVSLTVVRQDASTPTEEHDDTDVAT